MSELRIDLRRVDFREAFPWLHLFRGLELACDLKKVFLGLLGAVLTAAGWVLITYLANADVSEEVRRFPWEAPLTGHDPLTSPFNDGWVDRMPTSALLVIEPFRRLSLPAFLMFSNAAGTLTGILLAVWALVVWAFCGGAMTRIAAVQFAQGGYVSLPAAAWFVWRRMLSYIAAPVLPFVAIVIIVLMCAAAGVVARLPGGDLVVGFFWLIAIAAGFVMALAILGLVAGWPLMFAVISAEATDSLDPLARIFSYLQGKPWRFLFYVVVSILYGALLMVIVVSLAFLTAHLSRYAVGWGVGEANVSVLHSFAPVAGGWRAALAGEASPPQTTQYGTAVLIGFWTHTLLLSVVGFAYSYFWTQATIVYFLLRQDVDETDLEEVYLEEEAEEPFPTVAPSLASIPPSSESAAPPRESTKPAPVAPAGAPLPFDAPRTRPAEAPAPIQPVLPDSALGGASSDGSSPQDRT